MYGNLKAFSGHDAFNEYAHHLREFGEPILPHEGFIWIMRAGLLIALVVHVAAAIELTRRARRARPVKYVVKKHTGAIPASRLMRWGGLTLFLFIMWHLVNFTFGKVNVQGGPTDDPYNLLVDTLRRLVDDADLPGGDGDARRPSPPRRVELAPDPRPHRHGREPRPGRRRSRSPSRS